MKTATIKQQLLHFCHALRCQLIMTAFDITSHSLLTHTQSFHLNINSNGSFSVCVSNNSRGFRKNFAKFN